MEDRVATSRAGNSRGLRYSGEPLQGLATRTCREVGCKGEPAAGQCAPTHAWGGRAHTGQPIPDRSWRFGGVDGTRVQAVEVPGHTTSVSGTTIGISVTVGGLSSTLASHQSAHRRTRVPSVGTIRPAHKVPRHPTHGHTGLDSGVRVRVESAKPAAAASACGKTVRLGMGCVRSSSIS